MKKPVTLLWSGFLSTLFALILWGRSVNWSHATGLDGGILWVGIIACFLLFIGAMVVTVG